MKKWTSILLVSALLCTLTACQNKEQTGDESSSGSTDTSAVATFPGDSSAPETTDVPVQTTDPPATQATQPPVTQPPATQPPATEPPPTDPPQAETVRVTIKEGETLTQIFQKLEDNGVASFDALVQTAQSYDYSYYPLIAARPDNAGRCFLLEGYLFPDTYEFYVGMKPQDAIGRFLRNGEARITDAMRQQAADLGYSMDEVLTVASLIQKEGSNPAEVAKVAAVIYNRLKINMQLQLDATKVYIEQYVKPYLTGDVNRYNSDYNTYKCPALPAGPIANPGLNTINAALHPADVPYLYFCHDADGNYYYATTYEEHQENLDKINNG